MKRIHLLLIGVFCLATVFVGLLASVWLAADAGPMDYTVVAEFRELPLTDGNLKQWLRSQPGVYISFVERTGNSVSLLWGHAKTSFRDPVTPNIREEFERLGYKGAVNYKESKHRHDR